MLQYNYCNILGHENIYGGLTFLFFGLIHYRFFQVANRIKLSKQLVIVVY